MTRTELERYRQQLLAMGRRLRGEVTSLGSEALRGSASQGSGNLESVPGDSGDVSTDQIQQDVARGLLANERELLALTTAALERIERGTFGVCQICQRPIAAARLDALPYTPYCVECARTA